MLDQFCVCLSAMSDVAHVLCKSGFNVFGFSYALCVALFAEKKIYAVDLVEGDGLCDPVELFLCPVFDVV